MMSFRPCVVIPAYDEASAIGWVVRTARPKVQEVVVVDDGSRDGTGEEAQRAGATVLNHCRNIGKGAALKSGFAYALRRGFDPIVTLDGDGQHDPREMDALLQGIEEADLVIGCRSRQGSPMPLLRRFSNASSAALISLLSGRRLHDVHSGFRAIRSFVLGRLDIRSNGYDAEIEFLLKAMQAGFRFLEVRVSTIYGNRVGHIQPFRDTLKFLRAVGWSGSGMDRVVRELSA